MAPKLTMLTFLKLKERERTYSTMCERISGDWKSEVRVPAMVGFW